MFKLAIGNTVDFKTSIKLQSGNTTKTFSMELSGDRVGTSEWFDRFPKISEENFSEAVDEMRAFLIEHITDWTNQRLVIDDDGKPAEFSSDALRAVLDIPGTVLVIFAAYREATFASSGGTGRRKNSAS